MKNRFVPLEKRSKKEKARLARQKRVTWEFAPISRVKESKKIYQRKRLPPEDRFQEQPLYIGLPVRICCR